MRFPLGGIRVIELGVWVQAPLAATMLGDLGADVIKIEDRVAGDPSRGAMRVTGKALTDFPRSLVFDSLNRSKKGITVDLAKQLGKDIVYKLVEKSDVFLQNLAPGAAERMGLGYQKLSKYNNKLVYVSGSAFGPKGPEGNVGAVDPIAFARSGLMTVFGEADMPPIYYGGSAFADQLSSVVMAYGVLAAIIARERLGIGQEVNSSILGSLIPPQAINIEIALASGQTLQRYKRSKAINPLYNHYDCADGKWLILGMMEADRFWPGLCQAMGIQELEKDPKFDSIPAREKNCEELVSILDKLFATKPRDEWLPILRAGHLRCGPVNSVLDLVKDPQVLANDYVTSYEHPALGVTKTWGAPIWFSRTPTEVRLPPPEFGQHTEEVLVDLLGYSWEDIARFKEEGVI